MSSNRFSWRLVDITTVSVIGVTAGVVFFLWGLGWPAFSAPVEALLPGVGSFFAGVWLFAGVLGGLIVRKPGAALLAELLAALVSALLGSQWGITVLWSGLVQGLGAELAFALLLYRVYTWQAAMLAGAASGIAMAFNDLMLYYPAAATLFNLVYLAGGVLGGAVIAGLGSFGLSRALERAGALRRFGR